MAVAADGPTQGAVDEPRMSNEPSRGRFRSWWFVAGGTIGVAVLVTLAVWFFAGVSDSPTSMSISSPGGEAIELQGTEPLTQSPEPDATTTFESDPSEDPGAESTTDYPGAGEPLTSDTRGSGDIASCELTSIDFGLDPSRYTDVDTGTSALESRGDSIWFALTGWDDSDDPVDIFGRVDSRGIDPPVLAIRPRTPGTSVGAHTTPNYWLSQDFWFTSSGELIENQQMPEGHRSYGQDGVLYINDRDSGEIYRFDDAAGEFELLPYRSTMLDASGGQFLDIDTGEWLRLSDGQPVAKADPRIYPDMEYDNIVLSNDHGYAILNDQAVFEIRDANGEWKTTQDTSRYLEWNTDTIMETDTGLVVYGWDFDLNEWQMSWLDIADPGSRFFTPTPWLGDRNTTPPASWQTVWHPESQTIWTHRKGVAVFDAETGESQYWDVAEGGDYVDYMVSGGGAVWTLTDRGELLRGICP